MRKKKLRKNKREKKSNFSFLFFFKHADKKTETIKKRIVKDSQQSGKVFFFFSFHQTHPSDPFL